MLGQITSLKNGTMDSVQVGKAAFVYFANMGLEPRTLSYPGSCATNTYYKTSQELQICPMGQREALLKERLY